MPERRWRIVLAFWAGCVGTIAIFGAVQWMLSPQASALLFGVAVVVCAYVFLFGVPAYYALVRIARPGPCGRRPWFAYTAAALVAAVPYFLFLATVRIPVWNYWLAGYLALLVNGAIGYCMIERGMPWRWSRAWRDGERASQ